MKKKFPTISQFISVLQKGGRIFVFCLLGFIFLASFGLLISKTYVDYQKQQEVIAQRQKILSDVAYWEMVVEKYKGYRDGYFQLAVLEYQLGNRKKATAYLDKALELDPNFEGGRKLQNVLRSM